METKARELGIGGKLFYLFPSGGASVTTPSTAFSEFLSPHNLQEAVAAVKAGKVAASQMVDSQHTGHHPYYWGGGAAGLARHLMNEPDLKDVLEIGACNTETNAKQQAQNRAMMEAGDLNDWFNVVDIAKRLHLRASSFCMALVGLESYLSFSFLLFFFFFFFPLFLFRRSLYFVIRTYYLHYLLVPSDLIMQELYPASIKHPEEFWTKGKI